LITLESAGLTRKGMARSSRRGCLSCRDGQLAGGCCDGPGSLSHALSPVEAIKDHAGEGQGKGQHRPTTLEAPTRKRRGESAAQSWPPDDRQTGRRVHGSRAVSGPVLACPGCDIIMMMRQLLLRVPDDVHRRLSARAAREGRSTNALATEILDLAADADEGDRRVRLRARAATVGVLRASSARPVSAPDRQRAVASTRGIGPILDHYLKEERERR